MSLMNLMNEVKNLESLLDSEQINKALVRANKFEGALYSACKLGVYYEALREEYRGIKCTRK